MIFAIFASEQLRLLFNNQSKVLFINLISSLLVSQNVNDLRVVYIGVGREETALVMLVGVGKGFQAGLRGKASDWIIMIIHLLIKY